jgi:hypothetical protein
MDLFSTPKQESRYYLELKHNYLHTNPSNYLFINYFVFDDLLAELLIM